MLLATGAARGSLPSAAFELTSTAFSERGQIPSIYAFANKNIPPPLSWRGAPPGTKTFALVVEDPDAPGGLWTHWLVANLPPNCSELGQGSVPDGAILGKNSWGRDTYDGPAPPSGTHRYFFILYALDTPLRIKAGFSRGELLRLLSTHILGKAELTEPTLRSVTATNAVHESTDRPIEEILEKYSRRII